MEAGYRAAMFVLDPLDRPLDDAFLGRLRDHMAVVRRTRMSLETAQTTLRQLVHDASIAGASTEEIAAITGLPQAEIRRMTSAWPSLPDPAGPGTYNLAS